jgi:hypothetical protein
VASRARRLRLRQQWVARMRVLWNWRQASSHCSATIRRVCSARSPTISSCCTSRMTPGNRTLRAHIEEVIQRLVGDPFCRRPHQSNHLRELSTERTQHVARHRRNILRKSVRRVDPCSEVAERLALACAKDARMTGKNFIRRLWCRSAACRR